MVGDITSTIIKTHPDRAAKESGNTTSTWTPRCTDSSSSKITLCGLSCSIWTADTPLCLIMIHFYSHHQSRAKSHLHTKPQKNLPMMPTFKMMLPCSEAFCPFPLASRVKSTLVSLASSPLPTSLPTCPTLVEGLGSDREHWLWIQEASAHVPASPLTSLGNLLYSSEASVPTTPTGDRIITEPNSWDGCEGFTWVNLCTQSSAQKKQWIDVRRNEEKGELQEEEEEDREKEHKEDNGRLSKPTVSKHALHFSSISFSRRLHHSLLPSPVVLCPKTGLPWELFLSQSIYKTPTLKGTPSCLSQSFVT